LRHLPTQRLDVEMAVAEMSERSWLLLRSLGAGVAGGAITAAAALHLGGAIGLGLLIGGVVGWGAPCSQCHRRWVGHRLGCPARRLDSRWP
jgi:hypothetical protein